MDQTITSNMYPLKIRNSVFFVIFNSLETLYLPGYTIQGAVLTVIKERHCIKLNCVKILLKWDVCREYLL